MSRRSVIGLSGDPVTYGHMDLIDRAAKLFDELHVVVLENSGKKYLFSLEEREKMLSRILEKKSIPNLVIAGWDRLLSMYAYLHKIGCVVRGIRGSEDYRWETQIEDTFRTNKVALEFVYLQSRGEYRHISSSWVKGMVQEGASVHNMVPWMIKKELEKKILGQARIGVTGAAGVGKSTVIKKMIEKITTSGGSAHHIDFDRIVHRIYDTGNSGPYKAEIKKIEKLIPEFCIEAKTMVIQRQELRTFLSRIGTNRAKGVLKEIGDILEKPIENELQIEMREKKGFLFVESAILQERELEYVCNGDVILVHADKTTLLKRFEEENFFYFLSPPMSLKLQKHAQMGVYERGQLWKVDTSEDVDPKLEEQINQIVGELQNNFAS